MRMLKHKGKKKKIQSSSGSTTNTKRPIFSFHCMCKGTGYSLECCDSSERSAFSAFLFTISQMTWQEIQNASRHGLGSETISRKSIKQDSILKSTPDDARILAIRYNAKKPVIGYRDGEIFHVICLDHNFSVYQHS
jgi:hypothetical protein